jgi:hypothetical protein
MMTDFTGIVSQTCTDSNFIKCNTMKKGNCTYQLPKFIFSDVLLETFLCLTASLRMPACLETGFGSLDLFWGWVGALAVERISGQGRKRDLKTIDTL